MAKTMAGKAIEEGQQTDFVLELADRVNTLEKQVAALKAAHKSETRQPPMGRGELLFAAGDPVPSHGRHDDDDKKLWVINGDVLLFSKNLSGRTLEAGDEYRDGKVDRNLRAPCAPNNFCWIEL